MPYAWKTASNYHCSKERNTPEKKNIFCTLLQFGCKYKIIGSFSNDDSDGNQDVKKAIALLRKTTTLHVHHAFLYISSRSLHDYDVKCLIASFMEDVNKRGRISFSLSKLECGPQEINSWEIRLHLPFSANWSKRDKDWKNGNSF